MPEADLRYCIAKPDDSVPKVVLNEELIDGHGEVGQTDQGNEDGGCHFFGFLGFLAKIAS